jgi:hypothetical protein
MYDQIPAQHTYVMPTMILLRNWVKHKLGKTQTISSTSFLFFAHGLLGVDMRLAQSRIK